jgi:bifunctional NMN adenylyltransferase/nudix hydrolase
MEYQVCVFIGRFQGFHQSHLEVVRQGLKLADTVVIVIGSAFAAPNIKNPFTFQERVDMIFSCLTSDEIARVRFQPVRDYYYNDLHWATDVQNVVSSYIKPSDNVCLLGGYKDASSYYLKMFPQWEFVPAKFGANMDATNVRKALYDVGNFVEDRTWSDKPKPKLELAVRITELPKQVEEWLKANFIGRDKHLALIEENSFIDAYKDKWKAAPYAPTFVTTDAVVVQSGHVLLVKRKFSPGKGLWALPGGFIKESETIERAAIRELREETGIKVNALQLQNSVVSSKVFDNPGRSLRGRTITHAYYIKLPDGELAEVKGSDDAETARWFSLAEFGRMEEKIYEDHFHIVNYFINKG